MTSEDKLENIEMTLRIHNELARSQCNWLIERVKVLTEALKKAHRHCEYSGDGHYELGRDLREALDETGYRPG